MLKIGVAAVVMGLAFSGTASAQDPGAGRAEQCRAGPAQSLIGRRMSPRLREQARRLSGADVVRVLRPGTVVTMEYRADRLNVEVDRRGRIRRVNCG